MSQKSKNTTSSLPELRSKAVQGNITCSKSTMETLKKVRIMSKIKSRSSVGIANFGHLSLAIIYIFQIFLYFVFYICVS